eukprot:NODE_1257_length_1592_cov_0.340924.p2 type:complete len:136 gc:universal NODE_1257_length_1592_cov_0.340924:973-1380(+)
MNHWVLRLSKYLQIQFTKSGGKGGQNVNKRDTKVILKLNTNQALEDGVLTKEIFKRLPNPFIIMSQKERTQHDNLRDAKSRLEELFKIAELESVPKITKPETTKRIMRLQTKFKLQKRADKLYTKMKKNSRKVDF